MTCPLPYGFKAKANRIAVGLRLQLGLAAQVPIDVHALAAHLGITIVPLSAFKQWCSEQVTQLTKGDAGGFSAALILVHPLEVISSMMGCARKASTGSQCYSFQILPVDKILIP